MGWANGAEAPTVKDRAAAARLASSGSGRHRDMRRRTQGECGPAAAFLYGCCTAAPTPYSRGGVASCTLGRSKQGLRDDSQNCCIQIRHLYDDRRCPGTLSWSSTAKRSLFIDRARAKQAIATSPEFAELPNPALSRVRLLVSNLN
jgi:hypothetical protein